MELTLEKFKAAYPDLHAQIDSEAYQRGLAEGTEKGRSEGFEAGKTAERDRIRDVQAQSIPGHEKLVAELAFDGKTSGPEAAVKVLAADRGLREAKHASFVDDGVKPAKQAGDATAAEDLEAQEASLPVEERCKLRWERDAKVREEYKMGGLKAYVAFEKNKANIRINEKK